jgi:hypothetical protein
MHSRVKRWLPPSPPQQTVHTDFQYTAFVWLIPFQEMDSFSNDLSETNPIFSSSECSGSYAQSLLELVQVGDVGDQAGWGLSDGVG